MNMEKNMANMDTDMETNLAELDIGVYTVGHKNAILSCS